MGQRMSRLTVGGERQKTGGHDIESADICEGRGVGNKLQNRTSALLVTGRRDHAEGFMEGKPAAPLKLTRPIPDGDLLAGGVNLHPEGGRLSIHSHPALFDQLFGRPTRGDSGAGERPLEPHLGHDSASTYAAASSSPSETARCGWSAMVSSSARGRSARSRRPSSSRNMGAVPYSRGRPSASPRPTTSISPRSWSDRSTPPADTPRISSISARPTGWGDANTANGPRAGGGE